jgi:hypothetical protein
MSDRLSSMIQSVLDRSGSSENESLIIANHVSQMKTFGIRQGVELYPEYDNDARARAKFITSIWKQNKIEIHLDRMWDLLLCKGSLLFYLRPTESGYRIHYFYGGKGASDSQFKVFYDASGELEEAIIIYDYQVRSILDLPNARKWVKLRIRKDVIIQSETEIRPSFSQADEYASSETTTNTLGFVPCIPVWNYPMEDGQGADEFSWLDNQIVRHDSMSRAIADNMEFFGNPMLVSTRTSQEVLEASDMPRVQKFRPTMASYGTFTGADMPATRVDDPRLRNGSGLRVRRVIGGVEQDERFGFIHPDPVSTDHRNYLTQYRELLRTALGGVDELGFAAGATAFEIKSLFGRASATALKKCRALYDHGICEVFEMALFAEEQVFRKALANFFEVDLSEVTDEIIQYLSENNQIPPDTIGLMPMGDRTVKWRWTGPVFEDTPQDILNRSIVGRNMQEMGVKTTEILRFIYPDKTDQELESLVSGGFPYRYLGNIASTSQQILGLWNQMLQTPDPQSPDQPLGIRMDLTPMLESSLTSLYTELTRSRSPYEPADPADSPIPAPGRFSSAPGVPGTSGATSALPGTPSSAVQPSANAGVQPGATGVQPGTPIQPGGLYANSGSVYVPGYEPTNYGGSPVSFSGYGYAAPVEPSPAGLLGQPIGQQQQPMATGVQFAPGQNNGVPEYARALPRPGSTVARYANLPTLPANGNPGPGYPSQPIQQPGAVPDSDGTVSWFQRLFPTFTSAVQSLTGGANGPKRSSRRNSRDARSRKG